MDQYDAPWPAPPFACKLAPGQLSHVAWRLQPGLQLPLQMLAQRTRCAPAGRYALKRELLDPLFTHAWSAQQRARFGRVSREASARLKAATETQLQQLCVALVKEQTLEGAMSAVGLAGERRDVGSGGVRRTGSGGGLADEDAREEGHASHQPSQRSQHIEGRNQRRELQ